MTAHANHHAERDEYAVRKSSLALRVGVAPESAVKNWPSSDESFIMQW